MTKRSIKLGGYDTAAHGLWTLAAWEFPEPALEENLVQVPGRTKGPLDLSTALTEGEPLYGSRPLSITLESSEGDRQAREARISDMVNRLHGQLVNVVLPDHPMHYAVGRVQVKTLYNDLAHASVQVTGTCEPWLYAAEETVVELPAQATEQTMSLRNDGAMPVVPVLDVVASSGKSVLLGYGGTQRALSAGTYTWPTLRLTPGDHVITYSGSGILTITYREAVIR